MFVYGNDGHSMRAAHPLRVDRRDLDTLGRPAHMRFPVGAKVTESPPGEEPGWVEFASGDPPRDGERAFDHALTDDELEKEFPGYKGRVANMQRVAAVRAAVNSAMSDDEVARLVSEGTLKVTDISDLAEINTRLALRKKQQIK